MKIPLICMKCNGRGYISHFGDGFSSSSTCHMCKGIGTLGKVDVVLVPIQEYEELIEYKRMYEDLCK